MRGEHVALRSPGTKEHHDPLVLRIPRLRPQLLQGEQAGIATGIDDEVRLARTSGYRQR
jgi:hypothetical protein